MHMARNAIRQLGEQRPAGAKFVLNYPDAKQCRNGLLPNGRVADTRCHKGSFKKAFSCAYHKASNLTIIKKKDTEKEEIFYYKMEEDGAHESTISSFLSSIELIE
ncbi:hypothetical protein Y1Q_0024211 [Alligator mississippiensis]|uniref:Uncharacterized protein n=1 Tax=Alligator mississippiensis TaxID=8496 RepID=A0A151NI43_ALLMI|nr:hypothetical protein Y1Q_0024211 [Alligator mississippiensis]